MFVCWSHMNLLLLLWLQPVLFVTWFIFHLEHRNMPLDDAMPFLSRNFDNFVDMMKQKISAVNEWVAPNKKVGGLLNYLADGRRLTMSEMEDVDGYIQSVLSKMKKAQSSTVAGSELLAKQGEPVKGHSRGLLDHSDRAPPRRSLDALADQDRSLGSRYNSDMGKDRGAGDTGRSAAPRGGAGTHTDRYRVVVDNPNSRVSFDRPQHGGLRHLCVTIQI